MKRSMYVTQGTFTLVGAVLMAAVMLLTRWNCYVGGIFGIILGFAWYFAMVFADPIRDYLGIRALFGGVWIVTISLCQMRFLGYQEPWLAKTWLSVILAFVGFEVGGILCQPVFEKLCQKKLGSRTWFDRFRIGFRPNRLFIFCVVGTAVSVVCFLINILMRGYVPFFSNKSDAYLTFYARPYVFCVAATVLGAPCYCCLKTCKLKLWQKILLWVCIGYNVFAFPILVVSRSTFITAALILSAAIYYFNKRRFVTLVLCLAVMFGVYFLCSTARNYTDAQLGAIFETTRPTEPDQEPEPGEPSHTIVLPGKVAFIYSYLTVSHDNINEAVKHCTNFTFGLRQLAPFNTVLRSDKLEQALENCEYYLIRDHLNTINIAGEAYYDFGLPGMLLLPMLWAFAFGLMQLSFLRSESPWSLLAMGNAVSISALCFFATWLSQFSTWLFWGVALLLFLACGLEIQRKKTM